MSHAAFMTERAGIAPPIYAFNGDADGLCALQQLRLTEGVQARLITGVKRDIHLLQRVSAKHREQVTVLDVSHDQNRDDVQRLLDEGASLRYFDHHFAGELPMHPRFTAHINTAPDVCTSALVNGYLGGRHVRWAIVGAYGDALTTLGEALGRAHDIDAETLGQLAQLGLLLNYNAYGETVDDLHFAPEALADALLPFADPLAFTAADGTNGAGGVFAALSDGYRDDMTKARALRAERDAPGAQLIRLPDATWARRATGTLANERLQHEPDRALAVLSPKSGGGFVVSLRVPAGCATGADDFCRQFETGGGRKRAAGINHLPEAEFDRFAARFEAVFRV
ncbi:acetyltransferase [Paraburkholderia sp. A2WS-5]|uniref:acetyltransferase n=1 Tax=unclassified Paraburkholderia TaxID=2615204 RepID=UPI003B7C50BD